MPGVILALIGITSRHANSVKKHPLSFFRTLKEKTIKSKDVLLLNCPRNEEMTRRDKQN